MARLDYGNDTIGMLLKMEEEIRELKRVLEETGSSMKLQDI